MGLIKEFKDFALKGNVVDLAVGIIIGGAFGKIVSSLVGDIMMPIIGYFQKGASIGAQFLWLGEGEKPASLDAAVKSGQPYIAWGPFLQSTIDFMIVAFALFMIITPSVSRQRIAATCSTSVTVFRNSRRQSRSTRWWMRCTRSVEPCAPDSPRSGSRC